MRRITLLSVTSLTLCLTACDKTKTVLGFDRQENDPFTVSVTEPLSLPKDFSELPDPVLNSAQDDSHGKPKDKARDAAMSQFSNSVAYETDVSTSKAEAELLKNAKVNERDQEIRKTIASEASAEAKKNKSFVKDFLNIKDNTGQELDPFEEKKRLEEL
jgi:hypothetical protein